MLKAHHVIPRPREPSGRASWYVIRTNPNCEARAAAGLFAIGVYRFAPERRKTVRHARTLKHVSRPLFPRYIFVRIDPAQFYAVRKVNGVEGFLGIIPGEPHPIPDEQIQRLMDMEDAGAFDETIKDKRPLPRVGDVCEVAGDLYTGMIATVTEVYSETRIRLLFENLFGRQVPIVVSLDRLKAA